MLKHAFPFWRIHSVALVFLGACLILLTACPPQKPPAPTVTGVTLTFVPDPPFTTLQSGNGSPVVTIHAVEQMSDGTSRPGALRSIDIEVFPNAKGVISYFGSLKVGKPTLTATTDAAGDITPLTINCDGNNQPVQVRARDAKFGSPSNFIKFEFQCTP